MRYVVYIKNYYMNVLTDLMALKQEVKPAPVVVEEKVPEPVQQPKQEPKQLPEVKHEVQ